MNEQASETDDLSPRDSSPNRSRGRAWLPIAVLVFACLIVVADYLTKEWALVSLTEGRAVPVLGEALQWLLVMNPGAAFSFASGFTWVFTLLSSAVAVVILLLLWRVRSFGWSVFLGLVLGGTIGNLLDRLFRDPGFPVGHVVDFIYTPWMMPAIYNVADIAVVSGMGLFIILSFLGITIRGTRTPRRAGRAKHDGDESVSEGAA